MLNKAPKTNRRRTFKVRGIARPEECYTKEGVKRAFGLGDRALRMARRDGVKAHHKVGRVFYKGSQLIAWVFGEPIPSE